MRFKELITPFEKIEKLDKLRRNGSISEEEFENKKKKIMDEEI